MWTLDDVDFTVLAATSVLGDLMEKCPPAEACRDAFERMSKATVQMCLSTTGFGSQAEEAHQLHTNQPRPSFSSFAGENVGSYQDTSHTSQQSTQQASARQRRPPPKFDVNLRDLFPEESNHGSQFISQSTYLTQPNQQAVQRTKQEQPQQSSYPINSQINQGLGMTDPNAAGAVDSVQSQLQMTTNPSAYYNTSLYGSDFVGVHGMDFLDDGSPLNGTTPGIDLGFGMGMDFQHDWSDGTQYDLFDGFFFGGTGT